MDTKSTHIIAEFWGCKARLDSPGYVEDMMKRAVFEANATPIHCHTKLFDPQGVSVIVVVEESHLSIHTWPETGYAAVDAFTCGTRTTPARAIAFLRDELRPTHVEIVKLQRGTKAGLRVTSFSKSGTCCRLG